MDTKNVSNIEEDRVSLFWEFTTMKVRVCEYVVPLNISIAVQNSEFINRIVTKLFKGDLKQLENRNLYNYDIDFKTLTIFWNYINGVGCLVHKFTSKQVEDIHNLLEQFECRSGHDLLYNEWAPARLTDEMREEFTKKKSEKSSLENL